MRSRPAAWVRVSHRTLQPPHGDPPSTDTIVRMAQRFRLRTMLGRGQGQIRSIGRRFAPPPCVTPRWPGRIGSR
ncbi:hypothetical protein D6C00_14095 [Thiohalobacter thiocyanaticus]|uniref:Uncharacterized protein n=1 Tax=Thiohalobacter thiocyanaticus TaxID=585455 RepID=A0A426QME5_9GAMM|nr:hypothetical protein D6C00_14095 [Thiohalobacter thiocyanaticus]